MNNKIGYLAWLGCNYGSTLQSMGLYYSISHLGYNCEIVGADHFIKGTKPSLELKTSNPKRYDFLLTQHTFCSFIFKKFKFNKILGTISGDAVLTPLQCEEVKRFGGFVCGSDQIWKPAGFWFYPVQYLKFAPTKQRISYAPSVGWKRIPDGFKKNVGLWKEYLSEFSYLSSRESAGSKLIEQQTGRPTTTVVDPTMLVTPLEWRKIATEPKYSPEIEAILETKQPYILAYLLDTYTSFKDFVLKLADKLNLGVIWLVGRCDVGPVQINCAETDPSGFVNLIDGASFVCADGFHGTCFSINFSKEFLYLTTEEDFRYTNDSRVAELLDMTGIKGRVVSAKNQYIPELKPIDYKKVQNVVAARREISKEYLKNALLGSCENKGVLAAEVCGYIQQNILKEGIIKVRTMTDPVSVTPEFVYNPDIWKLSIDGRNVRTLVPRAANTPSGNFAFFKVPQLVRGVTYHLEFSFRYRSASPCINLHLFKSGIRLLQIIYSIDTSEFLKDEWHTMELDFVPQSNDFDSFMVGAAQITGKNGYLSFRTFNLSMYG